MVPKSCKNMKKGMHKLDMWQRKELPSVFVTWSDNNIVKILSNYHTPFVVQRGLESRIKMMNYVNKFKHLLSVHTPSYQVKYFESFALIDKEYRFKSKYDWVYIVLYNIIISQDLIIITCLFACFSIFPIIQQES